MPFVLQIAQRDDPPAKRQRLLESAGAPEGGAPEDEDLIAAVARKDVTEMTLRSKLEAHIEQSDQDHGMLLPAGLDTRARGIDSALAFAQRLSLQWQPAAPPTVGPGASAACRATARAQLTCATVATCSLLPSARGTRSGRRCTGLPQHCGSWCDRHACNTCAKQREPRQKASRETGPPRHVAVRPRCVPAEGARPAHARSLWRAGRARLLRRAALASAKRVLLRSHAVAGAVSCAALRASRGALRRRAAAQHLIGRCACCAANPAAPCRRAAAPHAAPPWRRAGVRAGRRRRHGGHARPGGPAAAAAMVRAHVSKPRRLARWVGLATLCFNR